MNKSKCPICKSMNTIKFGKRKGIQTYKCKECGYRFRNNKTPSEMEIWQLYQANKQTVKELSQTYGLSESTIKRALKNITIQWEQPQLEGGGYVHIDATYWGHNWGVMLAMDDASGKVLYLKLLQQLHCHQFLH